MRGERLSAKTMFWERRVGSGNVFETGSHCIAPAGIKLTEICQSVPPEYYD